MLLLAIMLYGLIALFIWYEIDTAHKKHQERKNRRVESFTVNNARHNTQKLSKLLDNTPKDKPYIPVRTIHKFDRKLYDEIMAQDEKAKANLITLSAKEIYTDSVLFDKEILDMIVSDKQDNTIRKQDTTPKYGVLTQRIALAQEKQKQKAESISISVPDSLSCSICGYKASSIKALNGHRKAHSKK